MSKRKLTNDQLIIAVEQVSSAIKTHEIESLILQVCTRVKSQEPLPKAAQQSGYNSWEQVALEVYRNLRRSGESQQVSDKKQWSQPMNTQPSSSSTKDGWSNQTVEGLQNLLSEVVKKFTPGSPDYAGIKDYRHYVDAWLEVPDLPGKYASVGYSKSDGEFYWCAPMPATHTLQKFLDAGYYIDQKCLYKDFDLPSGFFDLAISQQESWFIQYISDQLQEYDRLNLTTN